MMLEGEALKIIAKYCGGHVIILTITSAAGWPESTPGQLELPFIGCLGKASSFGLGLALASPDKRVMVLDGDGSLLMNLGTLVTIAHMAPPNLVYFVFENTVYEATGGQSLPGAGRVSFVGFAKAAGFPNAYEFDSLNEFHGRLEHILSQNGPTFVCLKVTKGGKRRPMRRGLAEALPGFKAALEKSLSET